MRAAPEINLDIEDRRLLSSFGDTSRKPSRLFERSRIVLLAAQGLDNQEIAKRLGISRQKVGRWRNRFVEKGMGGIKDEEPRSGRPLEISKTKKTRTANLTLKHLPESGRWTRRKMAEVSGLSASTIGRIWNERGIKPRQPAKKSTPEEQEETAHRLSEFRTALACMLAEVESGEFR